MALQVQTFTNISPDKFKAFEDKIEKDTGVVLPGVSGTVKHGPFEFTYEYDADKNILVIQVIHKPLFLKSTHVIEAIQEEIHSL